MFDGRLDMVMEVLLSKLFRRAVSFLKATFHTLKTLFFYLRQSHRKKADNQADSMQTDRVCIGFQIDISIEQTIT